MPDDQILVTNGLTQASFAAIFALIDPGDDVILLEPYYPQHVGKIELAGGHVITVPMDAEDNFRVRGDWIEQAVTARTKMIIIINPCNPTGRVFSRMRSLRKSPTWRVGTICMFCRMKCTKRSRSTGHPTHQHRILAGHGGAHDFDVTPLPRRIAWTDGAWAMRSHRLI